MDLLKPENLPLTIALLVPGVIAVVLHDLLVPAERRDWSKHLVEAVTYGGVNYILLRPAFEWLHENYKTQHLLGVLVALGIHVVSPVLLALAAHWARLKLAKYGRKHPMPTAWDFAFGGVGRKEQWVRVQLKDGRVVGGRWTSGSFAGESFSKMDIFISESWSISDTNEFQATSGESLLIREAEIALVEFIPDSSPTKKEEQPNARTETETGRLPAEGAEVRRLPAAAGGEAGLHAGGTADDGNPKHSTETAGGHRDTA